MLALTVTRPPKHMDMHNTDNKSTISLKYGRPEQELRKCLGNDTEEMVLKNYACAWQKDILIQGHLYLTAQHVCFYSNILGWETKLVLKWCAVTLMRKDKTARVFPNAIVITTQERKYGFSTFTHRNRAFRVLYVIWQNALLDQPLCQEELAQKVQMMKKTRSLDISSSGTPLHSPKTPRKFSLRVPFSRPSDSDTSESESPVLLSAVNTPTQSPGNTPLRLLHVTATESLLETLPTVTVTTDTDLNVRPVSIATGYHRSQGSFSSTMTDGTDIYASQDEEDKEGEEGEEGESERSELAIYAIAADGDETLSNRSDAGDYSATEERFTTVSRCGRRNRSPSTVALRADSQTERGIRAAERENGLWVQGSGGGGDKEGGGGIEDRGLTLRHILHNGQHANPIQLSLGRLKILFHDWCTPSNFINFLIIISIFLLLISTASMVCRISYANPSLHPYLPWQPWCRLCSECNASKFHTSGMVTVEEKRASEGKWESVEGGRQGEGHGGGLLTSQQFEELVKLHADDPYTDTLSTVVVESGHEKLRSMDSTDDSPLVFTASPP